MIASLALQPAGPSDDDTRRALIDVGEALFGQLGIAAASLRQIARDAGQKNISAVNYHFGAKADLVQAIVTLRWAQADDLVGRALAGLPHEGPALFDSLVRAAMRPGFDLKDAKGRRSYCRFVAALLSDAEYRQHWFDLETLGPNMKSLSARMRAYLGLSNAAFVFRTATLMQCFYHAASEHDAAQAEGRTTLSDDAFFDEMTLMLSHAWRAGRAG